MENIINNLLLFKTRKNRLIYSIKNKRLPKLFKPGKSFINKKEKAPEEGLFYL